MIFEIVINFLNYQKMHPALMFHSGRKNRLQTQQQEKKSYWKNQQA